MNRTKTLGSVACWIARLCALLLCLFWGAFFVEHLGEWFLDGAGGFPPAKVWIGQVLHLTMIVGLVMILFRPVPGAVVTVVGTVSFFSWIGVNRFPYVALVNLLPVIFVIVSFVVRKRKDAGAAPDDGPASLPVREPRKGRHR